MDYFSTEFPKTNNEIEGWHNIFKITFGISRFSLLFLILKIKNEKEIKNPKAYTQWYWGEIPSKGEIFVI